MACLKVISPKNITDSGWHYASCDFDDHWQDVFHYFFLRKDEKNLEVINWNNKEPNMAPWVSMLPSLFILFESCHDCHLNISAWNSPLIPTTRAFCRQHLLKCSDSGIIRVMVKMQKHSWPISFTLPHEEDTKKSQNVMFLTWFHWIHPQKKKWANRGRLWQPKIPFGLKQKRVIEEVPPQPPTCSPHQTPPPKSTEKKTYQRCRCLICLLKIRSIFRHLPESFSFLRSTASIPTAASTRELPSAYLFLLFLSETYTEVKLICSTKEKCTQCASNFTEYKLQVLVHNENIATAQAITKRQNMKDGMHLISKITAFRVYWIIFTQQLIFLMLQHLWIIL